MKYILNLGTSIVLVTALAPSSVGCAPVSAPRRGSGDVSPAIHESRIAFTYPEQVSSFGEIAFSELTLHADGDTFALHHGKYHEDYEPLGSTDVALGVASLVRSSGGAPQYAVISFRVANIGGSSSQTEYVQVLAIEGGHLVVRQQFSYDSQAKGTGAWFDPHSQTLLIVARADWDDAHCCPTRVDEAQYLWTGSGFSLSRWTTRPIRKQ